ncbi:unnamed protein product, partial [Medioppia subpectinata]
MATSKFKRMLNKELSHFSETKSGSQISEWVFRTFLDKQEDLDLPFLRFEDGVAQQSQPGHVVATAKSVLPAPRDRPDMGPKLAGQAMSQITGVKKPLSHTVSLTELPKHGVETPHEEKLDQLYQEIDKWGLDMYEIAVYSNKHPLTSIMYTIFKVSFY